MPAIAAPIAAWAAGAAAAGATAIGAGAIATGVGALAGAVATGVVYGAVIGATTALVTGGNVLDGALSGAIAGGVTGGVMSGLGMATGLSSATKQMASYGLDPSGAALKTGAGVGTTSGGIATPAELPGTDANLLPPAGIDSGVKSIATPIEKTVSGAGSIPDDRGMFNKILFDKAGAINPGTGKVLAGVTEGAAKALLTKAPESQSEYQKKIQDMNVAADFQTRTANIKIPTSWAKLSQRPTKNLSPATS